MLAFIAPVVDGSYPILEGSRMKNQEGGNMEGEVNTEEPQGNQATDEAGAGEEQAPLTVDELKALVQELTDKNSTLTTEATRKESEIQRLQGITRSLQKQGVSPEILSGVMKRLEVMEEGQATLLDALERQGGGGFDEPQTKKSHVQMLKERREQEAKAAASPVPDLDQAKFIQYAWSQGLDEDSQEVKDAVEKSGGDAKEALKLLRAAVQGKSEAEIQRRITEGIQAGIKGQGKTKTGVQNPSAASGAWRNQDPMGKIRLGVTK